MRQLVLGSRGSKLAMVQSQSIADKLECEVEIKEISTRGDKIHDVALAKLDGKGFFTKEIDEALLNGDVDLAVHSFKDVPTELAKGIIIAAIPNRETPKDALVGSYSSLNVMPYNAKIGTSSLRRKAEILKIRPDVIVEDLRGNLDTRMTKLAKGLYDAIIVAESGLQRLGYSNYHPLDPNIFIPAAGQGALTVTARADDDDVLKIISKLDDLRTRFLCECERLFLSTLESGCQIPAGVYTSIDDKSETFGILGFISSLDGKHFIKNQASGPLEHAKEITIDLTKKLLESGGREILRKIREGET